MRACTSREDFAVKSGPRIAWSELRSEDMSMVCFRWDEKKTWHLDVGLSAYASNLHLRCNVMTGAGWLSAAASVMIKSNFSMGTVGLYSISRVRVPSDAANSAPLISSASSARSSPRKIE
jgi:hypothetical protein